MTLDLAFFAVAVPAVLIAGIAKGGFGDVASVVATPLLALAAGPVEAIGILLPLLMVMDLGALRAYRGRWHGPSVRLLILSAVPGVGLGVLAFRWADADALRVGIGVMAFVFLLWKFAQALRRVRPAARPPSRIWGAAAGLVAGTASFLAHAGGPPVAMYLLAAGLGKTTYQATAVATFWAVNIVKAVPYALLGFFTAETLTAGALLLPVALLGVWLGVKAHGVVPDRLFFAVAYVALAAASVRLLWDALA